MFQAFFFVSDESVALADRCCHQSARFRHRNVFMISKDHLPLGKVVISKDLHGFSDLHIVSVLAHRVSHESADVTRDPAQVRIVAPTRSVFHAQRSARNSLEHHVHRSN